MRYTDIFLDFDDTLYDTRGNNTLGLREIYDYCKWNEHIPDFDAFASAYWRANEAVWASYTRKEMTRDVLIVERFMRPLKECTTLKDTSWITDEYCRKISDKYLEFCSCKPGTVEGAHELMRYLKAKGYRLHICSNGFHEVQYRKLKASKMDQYFDTVILSEDAGENKPGRHFFDYAFGQTKAIKETTLMIGDNYNTDILGALGYGLKAIWYNRWNSSQQPDDRIILTTKKLKEIENIL